MRTVNDQVLSPELESVESDIPTWQRRWLRRLEISTVLRLVGSGVIAMAILQFLFQRWDDASDLYRFGMIFGETVLLAALGLLTSRWLKEQKSARVFLGLSLVSVTAVFAILGAMLLSHVQWMPISAQVPDYARWVAESGHTLMMLLFGSVLWLGGQSWFGFSVLARPVAGRLTLLLMMNIALLLLPVRDMTITTLLVVPAALLGGYVLSVLRRRHTAMRTVGGTVAGLLAMLPLVVMIGRGALLYAQDAVAVASLALLSYLVMREIALSIDSSPRWRQWFESASLVPALLSAAALTSVLDSMAVVGERWLLPACGVLFVMFLVDLGLRNKPRRVVYLRAVAAVGLAVVAVQLWWWPDVLSSLLAIPVAGIATAYGLVCKDRKLTWSGLAVLLGAFTLLVVNIVGNLQLGSWVGLSLLGMITIIAAAAFERYGDRISGLWRRLIA